MSLPLIEVRVDRVIEIIEFNYPQSGITVGVTQKELETFIETIRVIDEEIMHSATFKMGGPQIFIYITISKKPNTEQIIIQGEHNRPNMYKSNFKCTLKKIEALERTRRVILYRNNKFTEVLDKNII